MPRSLGLPLVIFANTHESTSYSWLKIYEYRMKRFQLVPLCRSKNVLQGIFLKVSAAVHFFFFFFSSK